LFARVMATYTGVQFFHLPLENDRCRHRLRNRTKIDRKRKIQNRNNTTKNL